MRILGIDIGGTGIKGAPVDTQSGKLLGERYRIPTPHPATPQAVAATVADIVAHFGWSAPIGCAVPAVVQQGVVRTAANISETWVGKNAGQLFEKATKCPVTVINDADAAGYAEKHFGAGRGKAGVVMIVTLGTGIGTALFSNGHLVPNTELGHLEMGGKDAEKRAADSVRVAKDLSWEKWAQRVDTYLHYLQRYFWPDLLIIGGGVSKKSEKFLPHLTMPTPVVPAQLQNEAGIIGAALAREHEQRRVRQKLALG
jgi:polyphosphate glucokinase